MTLVLTQPNQVFCVLFSRGNIISSCKAIDGTQTYKNPYAVILAAMLKFLTTSAFKIGGSEPLLQKTLVNRFGRALTFEQAHVQEVLLTNIRFNSSSYITTMNSKHLATGELLKFDHIWKLAGSGSHKKNLNILYKLISCIAINQVLLCHLIKMGSYEFTTCDSVRTVREPYSLHWLKEFREWNYFIIVTLHYTL